MKAVRAIHRWIALAMLVVLPTALSPLAALHAHDDTVECCCGPHDIATPCGCSTCPSARASQDHDDDDHGHDDNPTAPADSIQSCQQGKNLHASTVELEEFVVPHEHISGYPPLRRVQRPPYPPPLPSIEPALQESPG